MAVIRWVPGVIAIFGVDMVAVPERSVTGLVTSWPSLAKVMVPVGSGLVGVTVEVKVYEASGATVAADRLREVLLAPWVEPVTVTMAGVEMEGA
jgi:hypothetical protein